MARLSPKDVAKTALEFKTEQERIAYLQSVLTGNDVSDDAAAPAEDLDYPNGWGDPDVRKLYAHVP